ncbi:MAG TPA: DegQ family serine endoprotease [Dissulfurispiraceae bacterium]|nr:DegQ family serine endoprotease [Dissulfurispiraceae bacterium]
MKNKLLWVPALLLTGFLFGGMTYYLISIAGNISHRPFSPRVPAHIEETSKAFSEIVKAVSPAVVNISSTKLVKKQQAPYEDFFDYFTPSPDSKSRKFKEQSLGSGVIVSHDGYIVTNSHVIEQSSEIRVTLYDKRSFRARTIGSDLKTDIAIIKIDAKDLPLIPWGDAEKLQVGEFVLAIGNPFLLSNTVTMGIVSAVGRADVGIADYEDFIQTDAAINPGNSGGPLVNIKGELVGINTAIFSKTGGYQGIGFAVPSNMVKAVMEQLINSGRVTRGWIGITIQELTPELAQQFGLKYQESELSGVLVSDVTRGGPAQKASIMRGDIIIEYNGRKIQDVGQLRNLVAQSKVGSQATLKILRKDKEITVTASVAELPAEGIEAKIGPQQGRDAYESALAGMRVMDLTAAVAKQLGIETDEKGVVIVSVESGAPCEEANLRRGDVINEINRQRITNLNDFNKIVAKIKPGDNVLLFVNRGGRKFYIAVDTQ